jgi:type IV pilus assembly protein PilA
MAFSRPKLESLAEFEMQRKGFTLIELMIVIAIIAIIAAIAIPGILAAIRAANERNASGSLKQMSSVEVMVKSSDSDSNGINDYWTADVAGLYHVRPTGSSVSIRTIELSVALADGNVNAPAIASAGTALPATHISSPKAGYWFQAQLDFNPSGVVETAYGNQHVDRFSFIAYPNSYGSSGKLVFIVSEGGTMWKRDGLSDAAIRNAGQPVTGVNDTAAVLDDLFDTFPENPVGPTQAGVHIGPWSKME